MLEKHHDFLRDFRGDTIHPSTMEVLHELGLLEEFLKLPHQETRTFGARVGDTTFPVADFSRLRAHCRFLAFIVAAPQRQRRLTTEHLRMVQQRRTLPTRVIQSLQLAIQKA